MDCSLRPRAALLVGLLWPLVACGGSAAESPWPVEPLDTEPGPAGEAPPGEEVIDVDDLPKENRYGDAGANPAEKDEAPPADD